MRFLTEIKDYDADNGGVGWFKIGQPVKKGDIGKPAIKISKIVERRCHEQGKLCDKATGSFCE